MTIEDTLYAKGYYDFGDTTVFYDSHNQMFYGKNYATQQMMISDKLKHLIAGFALAEAA